MLLFLIKSIAAKIVESNLAGIIPVSVQSIGLAVELVSK